MKLNIRLKLILFTFCMVLLVGGSISLSSIYQGRQRIINTFEKDARKITAVIAESVVDDLYFLDLRSMREKLKNAQINPDIQYTYVTDLQGIVLADGTGENALRDQKLTDAFSKVLLTSADWVSQVEDGVLKVGGPILMADRSRVGHFLVVFSLDSVNRVIRDATRASLYITIICLAIGVVMAFIIATTFSRSILPIVHAARDIGDGRLDTRLPNKRDDELGTLAESINQMAEALQARETEAKQAEETLQVRYQELQAMQDISQAILNSPDLGTIMPEVLNKALQIGPFDIGVIRLLEPGGKILKPVAMWGYRDLKNVKDKGTEPGDPTSGTNVMRAMIDKGAQVVENVPESQGLRAYKKEGVQSAVVIPVRGSEEILGIFQLGSRTPRKFWPQQISLLEAIGSQVGIAAQKARLFTDADRRRKHAEALREIGLSLTTTHDAQQVLQRVAEEARQLTGALFTFVATPDKPFYRFPAVAGDDQGYREILKLSDDPDSPYGQGPLGRAVRACKPIVCEDVLTDPLFVPWRDIAFERGIRSLIAVPLLVQEQAVGALLAYAPMPGAYDDETMSLLSALAAQAAAALENRRLFEAVSKKSQELESLVGINREVAAVLDREALLPRIAEEARKILKADSSVFRLVEGEYLVLRSASDPQQLNFHPKLRLDESVSGKIVRENRIVAVSNVFEDSTIIEEHQEILRNAGYYSFLGVPLRARGRVIGTLNFYFREEKEFRPEELDMIGAFADQAAIAVENAGLYQESRRQEEVQKLLKELSQGVMFFDAETLFKRLTDRVREFFKVDVCDVRMIENWQPVGVSGIEPERIRGTGQMHSRSRWIVENRKPLAIADIAQEADGPMGSSTRRVGLRGYLAVPLFSRGGEVVGIMRALTYRPREFTQEEIDLLQQLANGAALSLENAKLFHETELRAKEQAVLNAIAMATSRSLDLKELLTSALDKVLEVMGRERGFIRFKDPVTGNLILAAHRGISESYARLLLHERTPGGKSDRVFKSGEPLVVNDTEGTLLREETRNEGNSSIAWIPLKAKGTVVGILNVSTSRPIPFAPREVELLQAIGNVIGVAVENARLFEETRRSLERVRAMREVDQAISSSLDVQTVLDVLLEKMALLFPFPTAATVQLLNRETWRLELAAICNLDARQERDEPAEFQEGLPQAVFSSSVPLVVNNLADDPRAAAEGFCRRHGFVSYLGVPLTVKGERLGVISLYAREAHRFTDDEVDLLSTVAGQAALAIQNSQLYEQTRIQAVELSKTNKGLQRREEIQKLLKELSQDITSLEIDSLVKKLTAKVREFFRMDISDVRVFESGTWRQIGVSGIEPERLRGRGKPRSRANWVVENRKPLMIPDVTQAADLSPGETTRRLGIRGYLAVPLFSQGGEVMGILRALSYQPREFTQEEIDLLQQLANGAALAVANARLFEETQRSLERVRALREIDQAITSTLHLETVLNVLLEKIDLFQPHCAATIRLLNEESGLLEPVACRNLDEKEWKVEKWKGGRGLANAVFETKTPVIICNAQTDPRVLDQEFYRKHRLVSYLGVPLIAKDQALGVLNFYTRREQEIPNEEVEFLSTIAGQAAIAIYHSQLYERLKKQTDELETANKVKDEFLSTMSHELRTPLNVVVGYAEMMRDQMLGKINQQQKRALGKMMRRSRDLLDMIESVLQATGIEAGTVKVESYEVHLGAFLGDLKLSYDFPLAGETTMVWDIPSDLPSVKTDAEKLKRILQSVIQNAVKFTPKGRITISARPLPGAGMVEFKVADTGIGIAQELQSLIFEMFRQGDSSETRPYGGVGLGLYIARRLTEMLGGTIGVKSHPGKGSTFTVTIPCEGCQAVGNGEGHEEAGLMNRYLYDS